ncbi:MAG: alanine--tRNA ligase [Bacilli bacterium]|jgi:alanyl-tRNA synthetase|nr:alanine--tRNA ligase [Bacilli bacterium]
MKYYRSYELRKMFLDYFKQQQHTIEPGVGLVPKNDPSLLWINSGVSALKKYFDGSIKLDVPRIANSQRSIRTNDIENVGLTARHHTMFEMLGNFSIGDYFKEGAIKYAWDFLTNPNWVGLDIDKLYVTIYLDDDEAYDIWHDVIGLDASRIFRLEGNFWEIGSGPCGPNSEIFYDRGEHYDPEHIGIELLSQDMDNDRYIEIWNIVFSQFNAEEGKERSEYLPLPQQNIDTGMGLERLTSIVQEVETNFETDLFVPIISAVEQYASFKYEGSYKRAYKVIADHIRAITFALADGAMFANEGRGYVLRRLLRRASRYGLELGIEKPFLYEIVSSVIMIMKEHYEYLVEHEELIKKIVKSEEERFHKTLNAGLNLFNEVKKHSTNNIISGEDAFKLYDTYGFPIELSCELANEANFKIDMDKFNELMTHQQALGRASFNEDSNFNEQSAALLAFNQESLFVGYDQYENEGKIIGLFKNGHQVETLSNEEGEIIFDKTCFYAQSGGQVSDQGSITIDNQTYEVLGVRKAPHGQHLHLIKAIELRVGSKAQLKINYHQRVLTARNHTATHLLHQALKDIVGSHVNQAGSYVSSEYLRFDFNHFEKLTSEQLILIEEQVNKQIFNAQEVNISLMNIEDAKQQGAQALFDEKYGDVVRVINIPHTSIELCGGTHVNNIESIGLFKIDKEESVGSGIRRITAFTSQKAYQFLNNNFSILNDVMNVVGIKDPTRVIEKTKQLKEDLNNNINELKKIKSNLLKGNDFSKDAILVKDYELYFIELNNTNVNEMKDVVSQLKNKYYNGLIITKSNDEKHSYVIGIGKELLAKGYDAKELSSIINDHFEGKGGGKPDMAQGATNKLLKKELVIKILENL